MKNKIIDVVRDRDGNIFIFTVDGRLASDLLTDDGVILGLPCKRVSAARKKSFLLDGEPYEDSNDILYVYSIDWKAAIGAPIAGTNLEYITVVSSSDLSDATFYQIAFNENGIISTCHISYLLDDRDSFSRWLKLLRSEYPSSDILAMLES